MKKSFDLYQQIAALTDTQKTFADGFAEVYNKVIFDKTDEIFRRDILCPQKLHFGQERSNQ